MTYQIEILSPVCIKAFKEYEYKICHDIELMINGEKYVIPANFKTDLASIPKIIWPVLSPAHSSLMVPAIVHDWFYRMTGDFTRLQTDLIFYQLLRDYGVSKLQANAIYYAVRAFGGAFYHDIKTI